MPQFHIATADPLDIGTLDGSTAINVTNISGGPRSGYSESLAGAGFWIESAVKALRPVEEWQINYELLDGASFAIAFGVPVNTAYLVTACQATCSAKQRPTVSVTVVKPSAANKIKSYVPNGSAPSLSLSGGYGVVSKFGATSTGAFISSSCSIGMQTGEADEETSGDYLQAGLYHYGFKQEVTAEAYAAITPPSGSHVTSADAKEDRDGFMTYAKSFWIYMDAV